jgi:hypothetical protein
MRGLSIAHSVIPGRRTADNLDLALRTPASKIGYFKP